MADRLNDIVGKFQWSSRPVMPLHDALIIAGGYAISSAVWILVSDQLLVATVADGEQAARISLIKGWLFVVVTATILFAITNRYLSRLKVSEERYREAQGEIRLKELAVRQGYVDVLDAVTGGKLILITEQELKGLLGEPLMEMRDLPDAQGLSFARSSISRTLAELPLGDSTDALILAVSEALTNAIKHGGSGQYGVFRSGGCLQIVVRDFGPGIDFRALPKATLIQGFSTTNTMGLGFTIMLEVCDRVLLTTDTHGTVVVLELEMQEASATHDRPLADVLVSR